MFNQFFDRYIPKIDAQFDFVFFTNLARFLKEDPSHQLVSVQDIFPHSTIQDSITLCYVQGHGERGQIGVVGDEILTAKEVKDLFKKALESSEDTSLEWLHRTKQIFVVSCYAAATPTMHISSEEESVEPPLSIVDSIRSALTEYHTKHDITTQMPEIVGCQGVTIAHPNINWPIVQVKLEQGDNSMWLQHLLLEMQEEAKAEAKRIITAFITEYQSQDDDSRLQSLKEVSEKIGLLAEPHFGEHISLLYAMDFLNPQCFVRGPDGIMLERSLPTLSPTTKELFAALAHSFSTAEGPTLPLIKKCIEKAKEINLKDFLLEQHTEIEIHDTSADAKHKAHPPSPSFS